MKKPIRILFFFIAALIATSPMLFAEKYEIKDKTPEIQQAFSNRKARYSELESLKSSGAIGENNQGYVQVLSPAGNADEIASAENADRRVIYNAIVQQNGLGAAGLTQVQATFAEVRRDKANAGDPIQLPSGEWTKK